MAFKTSKKLWLSLAFGVIFLFGGLADILSRQLGSVLLLSSSYPIQLLIGRIGSALNIALDYPAWVYETDAIMALIGAFFVAIFIYKSGLLKLLIKKL